MARRQERASRGPEAKLFYQTAYARDPAAYAAYERDRGTMTESLYRGKKGENCFLCNQLGPNVRLKDKWYVRLNPTPYTYGHFMFYPQSHKGTITEISPREFKHMALQMGEIAQGMREQGLPIIFASNHGAIAGQTIAHLHVHGMPQEWGNATTRTLVNKGVAVQKLGDARYFDPLALQIMHSMKHEVWTSSNRILQTAIIPERRGEGIVLRFKSFEHLAHNYAAVKELFRIGEETFRTLEEHPERAVSIPPVYKEKAKARRDVDERLLRTQLLSHYTNAADNFGAQWMVREAADGGVEFHFLPRATAIILPQARFKDTMTNVVKAPSPERAEQLRKRVQNATGKRLLRKNVFVAKEVAPKQLKTPLGELRFSALQHFAQGRLARGEQSAEQNVKLARLDRKWQRALHRTIGRKR